MNNLEIANLCYQVVDEMMEYANSELEYDEVSKEVRKRFEQDYGISNEVIVFWLKEQDELEEMVMSYKKTCQIYLKLCSYNEITEFINQNSNAYDFLVGIINYVEPEVKKLIEGVGVMRKLIKAK